MKRKKKRTLDQDGRSFHSTCIVRYIVKFTLKLGTMPFSDDFPIRRGEVVLSNPKMTTSTDKEYLY